MQFDNTIINNELKIYCPNSLAEFSKRFINYYDSDIPRIKKFFNIDKDIDIIISLFDNIEDIGFVGKTDFSGYFTDTGAMAYIQEGGKYSDDYLFKGLMHELEKNSLGR